MPENTKYSLIMTSCSNRNEADALALHILDKRLAACVSVIPGVRSHYWWENKIESDNETVLLIKTESSRIDELISEIQEKHSYSNPEVIALPIIDGSPAYLMWVSEVVGEKP